MTMGTNKPNDWSRLLDLLVRPHCLWTVCESISKRRPDPEKSAVFVGGVDAWLSLYTVKSSLALVDAPTSQPLRIIHPFSSSLQGNTHKQPFTLIFTRTAFLYPPNKCLWMGRESWNTRRELMQTREKHESSIEKCPYSPQGIQTPSWRVPVLTTVLLHPLHWILSYYYALFVGKWLVAIWTCGAVLSNCWEVVKTPTLVLHQGSILGVGGLSLQGFFCYHWPWGNRAAHSCSYGEKNKDFNMEFERALL